MIFRTKLGKSIYHASSRAMIKGLLRKKYGKVILSASSSAKFAPLPHKGQGKEVNGVRGGFSTELAQE
jgi:hypothetical protein